MGPAPGAGSGRWDLDDPWVRETAPVYDSLVTTTLWAFNLAALLMTRRSRRADLLRRVVLRSWDLLVGLAALQMAWSLWSLWSGQPVAISLAVCWLGVNLLMTVNTARRYAAELSPQQIVLLCSWWIALLAMVTRALFLARSPDLV
ncbi:MAG: hypothetical protein HYU66_02340 [Armatimonadetes bacterium]|nr:hypothetical protein [Armatimonadota bacterium]